ncbi:MAG: ribbon-helix-helix domain-containing protein [Actinobacteria bacterium]|nr:ribbon-helix-helix domain-containing protein [Actinomycetota bacterium]
MDKDRTNVLLEKDMMISLKNMARLEGKSVTMIVREAVMQYLSKNLKKHEFGIIGIGRSNLGDLSTEGNRHVKKNKKI